MWSKVADHIRSYNLLNTNDLYIVALSGGADSVSLLLLLHEHGYRVEAAHCNFRLRGEESDRDERFCEELCERLRVPLHRVHFDTEAYAELHKVSLEMAARELRYRWFGQLCQDVGAAGVCVAHHRNDSVETVLLNLVRGTGLRGLTGIRPRNELEFACGDYSQKQQKLVVLRPLLCVSREEIERFLVERGQGYITDSSNLEADFVRNKIRLQVLPLLKTLNAGVNENIQRTAENLASAQAALDAVLFGLKDSNELILSNVSDCASREYIAFEWLKKYGFNGSQVRQILDSETGKIFSSAEGFDVLKDRGRLLVEPTLVEMNPLKIPEEGVYVLGGETARCSLLGGGEVGGSRGDGSCWRVSVKRQAAWVSKLPDVATVDVGRVQFPLTIRRVEEGDWMVPYGMKGRKLLSDLMTDRKMTLFEKRRQMVVVDAQGIILWVVGLRVDARVAVVEDTQEVLEIKLVSA
jgi:tRNA(Ile)-lysidine synthase